MKKITKATVKSFEKKNRDKIYIKVDSYFNGMIDGIDYCRESKFKKSEYTETCRLENNLGHEGFWLVGSSRDYFKEYEDDNFIGYIASNCCGSTIIAIKKVGS